MMRLDGHDEEVVMTLIQVLEILDITVSEANAVIDYLNTEIYKTMHPDDVINKETT